MNKDEFFEELKSEMAVDMYRQVINKNNGTTYDGFVLNEDNQIRRVINLDYMYQKYQDGMSVSKCAEEINEALSNRNIPEEFKNFNITNYNQWKKHLIIRLVNHKRNAKFLDSVVYFPFLDLAAVVYVLVDANDENISSFAVTKNLYEECWKQQMFEERFVLDDLLQNTRRLFPLTVCGMVSMIKKILLPEEECPDLFHEVVDSTEEEAGDVIIATNTTKINGATVMLYPDFKDYLSNRVDEGNGVYLLPSSVHELIVLPYREDMSVIELQSIVREVNQDAVKNEDFLSDNVYFYKNGEITIAK